MKEFQNDASINKNLIFACNELLCPDILLEKQRDGYFRELSRDLVIHLNRIGRLDPSSDSPPNQLDLDVNYALRIAYFLDKYNEVIQKIYEESHPDDPLTEIFEEVDSKPKHSLSNQRRYILCRHPQKYRYLLLLTSRNQVMVFSPRLPNFKYLTHQYFSMKEIRQFLKDTNLEYDEKIKGVYPKRTEKSLFHR